MDYNYQEMHDEAAKLCRMGRNLAEDCEKELKQTQEKLEQAQKEKAVAEKQLEALKKVVDGIQNLMREAAQND